MGRRGNDCASETLEVLDVFSTPIHLSMNKKRTLTSTLGGLLSIAIVFLILYQTGLQFFGMINHDNPQIYQIKELEENPSNLLLNKTNNFFMAILITVDSTIINITAGSPLNFPTTFNKYRKQSDGTMKKHNYQVLWAPCNQSDFPDSIYGKNAFTTVSLQKGYCAYGINYKDTITGECPEEILTDYPMCITPLSIELKGGYVSEEFDFVQANMKICDQNDPTVPYGMKCSTDDILTKFQTSSYEVTFMHTNTAINMVGYDYPNRTFIQDIYWKLNPKIYKVTDIFVDRVTIEDADDYLSSDNVRNRSYAMVESGKAREVERMQNTIGEKILQFNFRRSNKNLVISRTYVKVQDILTDLGGFSKAAMFIFAFLAIGFVRYKYHIQVANGLYDFDVKELPQKNSKKGADGNGTVFSLDYGDSNAFSMLESPTPSHLMSPGADFNGKDFGSNKPIVDYFTNLQRRGSLEESEWAYFKLIWGKLCCKKDPRAAYAKKAQELASKDLDLMNVIRKLGEFDILTTIILNRNQKEVLDFFENPLLTMSDTQTIQKIKTLRASVTSVGSIANLAMAKQHQAKAAASSIAEGEDPKALMAGKLKGKLQGKLDKVKAMNEEELADYRKSKKKRKESDVTEEDFSSLSRYGKLYMAYRYLRDDDHPANMVINMKLIRSLNTNLLKVFQRIDQLLGHDYTIEQFEQLVKNILEAPSQRFSIRFR